MRGGNVSFEICSEALGEMRRVMNGFCFSGLNRASGRLSADENVTAGSGSGRSGVDADVVGPVLSL